ncbi:nitrous oxide reductase accessory protein NosL [Mesobacillus subterraneus]|uniref:Nitrous oxide reduction protein n=1 Tax=Mesobacillus subterraneus TaxID=285983 RepID=A0A427TQR1_9BACI|nr:nitrous oxide reductase accessory protein NosL [Mesobacillus subterraneus]RSD26708.1 nitrous oxide reduction protein [Mesobacillus subterraneus]
MIKKLGIVLLLLASLTGCQNSSMEPEEINPEIDVCEVCNMGIAHEHFATEVVTADGEVYKFDDIGCMEEFLEKESELEGKEEAKKYVRDVDSGEWVELHKAYHAFHPDFWTPMANGVVSFKDQESADRYVKEQGMGDVLDYEALKKHEWSWGQ